MEIQIQNSGLDISPLTEVMLVIFGLWIVLVLGAVWYISKKVMPGIRHIMKFGTETEKREVLKTMFPPRFKR